MLLIQLGYVGVLRWVLAASVLMVWEPAAYVTMIRVSGAAMDGAAGPRPE